MDETDAELLSRYGRNKDEAAFTELVKRHLGLVYSAACRETEGDAAAAEDVTQLVFIELARKAQRLTGSTPVAGWLYTSVRYVSANRRRAQLRRALREQQAHIMNEPPVTPSASAEPTWESLRPVLDDALHELNERDRYAVVLRFLEGHTLQKVGDALGLTENAARMRVDRALEKLRPLLAKRGVTSSASGLALVLGTIAGLSSPPATLANSVINAALASTTATASTLLTTLTSIGALKLGFLTVIIATLIATPWVVRQLSQADESKSAAQTSSTANTATTDTTAVLSGAFLFSTDPAGNPAGNMIWDTRGTDSDFYKVWITGGTPRGVPDGLTAPFLNGPLWADAPLRIPLHEGINSFTVFFQHDGMWPTMGLNLFFNSSAMPALSVIAPARTNDSIPPHSPNQALRTYTMRSYPIPNGRAPGASDTIVQDYPIALTEFYHVATTNFFSVDRVSSHAATNNGRFDCVVSFTLFVSPRRTNQPQAQLRGAVPQ